MLGYIFLKFICSPCACMGLPWLSLTVQQSPGYKLLQPHDPKRDKKINGQTCHSLTYRHRRHFCHEYHLCFNYDHHKTLLLIGHFTDYEKTPDSQSKRTVVIKTVETRDGEVQRFVQTWKEQTITVWREKN